MDLKLMVRKATQNQGPCWLESLPTKTYVQSTEPDKLVRCVLSIDGQYQEGQFTSPYVTTKKEADTIAYAKLIAWIYHSEEDSLAISSPSESAIVTSSSMTGNGNANVANDTCNG